MVAKTTAMYHYTAKPMNCLACYVQVMAFHCLRRRLPMTKICVLDLIITDGNYSSSRICACTYIRKYPYRLVKESIVFTVVCCLYF